MRFAQALGYIFRVISPALADDLGFYKRKDGRPMLPGTPHHQALLRAVQAHYASDPRVLAVTFFGSLGRGNWDEFSDLDLDVILADGVGLDVMAELRALGATCEPLGEQVALLIPDGDEAGDIVFASLMGLSVRYHPLATTSPNIVDSLVLLVGSLDAETIRAAGRANQPLRDATLALPLARFIRLTTNVDIALQRRAFWRSMSLLHLLREYLLGLFAASRGAARAYASFEAEAEPDLQARLGQTLPGYSLQAVQQAFLALLDLTEAELPRLTAGQATLEPTHQAVLAAVRQRQATLVFGEGEV